MKNFIAALGLWFWLVSNALAADTLDIPPMDFQRFCEAKAAIFGRDENIRATCLREEKGMIDFLLKGQGQSFVNVPVCLDAARSVGGSYTVLGLCLIEQKRQGAAGVEPGQDKPEKSSVPAYDTKKYCSQVGEAIGGSAQVEKFCREEEASNRSALEKMSIPEKVLKYCDGVAQAVGGSYQILKVCVEQELEARQSLEE